MPPSPPQRALQPFPPREERFRITQWAPSLRKEGRAQQLELLREFNGLI